MGSKGSNTTTQNETYQANPLTAQYATQLGQQASNLPGPGNVPLQGVQGFSPDQYAAFQNVRNLQGTSNPYFQAASSFINQGASPVTQAQTQNYFNPYFQQQMAALNDQLGAKNVQARGSDVQSAGGVGADRLGVAEAERFRQDQLARGQLAGNTYQAALAAAQQDKQRQEAAGALMGNLGPAALGAGLQETGALYNMGSQQQQLGQAGLAAQYAQQLGQYQNPYQNLAAQQAATATMAGALGGTKTQTKTLPAASPWGSILGLAGTAAGAFFGGPAGASIGGQLGSALGGGGSGKGSNEGFNSYTQPSYYSQNYGTPNQLFPGYGSGMAAGGVVNPYDFGQGFQSGGEIDATDITLNEDALGLGKPWEPTNSAIEADSGFPSTSALGFSGAPAPTGPKTALPSMEPQAPQGLPSLPNVPAPAGPSRASNPWTALMHAGLATMAASGRRDAHGIPLSPLAAVGEGGMAGVKMLQQQQTADREERRVQMEAERLLEQAKMSRLPYSQMTAAQKQQATQAARPYSELTEMQKQEITLKNEEMQRKLKLLELEGLKPFKIGVDQDTGLDTYGIRDPKTNNIIPVDPRTGKPISDAVSERAPQTIGEDYLKTLPAGRQEELKQIYEGRRAPPPPNPRSQQQIVLSNQLARAYPDFDAVKWKTRNETNAAFSKGPEGRVINSTRTVVGHMHDAMGIVQELAQKDIKTWNRIENAVKDQLGDTALSKYNVAKNAIADELARVFTPVGASHEGEKQRWLDVLDNAKTPEQFKGVFGTATQLLASRFEPLKMQFGTAMGWPTDDPRVVEKAGLPPTIQKKYEDVQRWSGVGGKKELAPQDKSALDWANKNPNDPRAKEIKKRLGAE